MFNFKFLLAVVVFLAVLGGGTYYAFFKRSDLNVRAEIDVPEEVMMGESFDARVSYTNNSPEALKDARLTISLPDNVYFYGRSEGQRVIEDSLGEISPGDKSEKTYKLVALRETQVVKRIQARLIYSLESSRGNFESRTRADVVISGAAAFLSLESPESVFSGEEFEIILDYKNQSNENFRNVIVRMDYPPAFTFGRSEPKTSESQNIWSLQNFSSSSDGKIVIRGSAIGEEDAPFLFNATLLSNANGETYEIQRQSATVNIKRAPLSVKMVINRNDNYIARIDDTLNYSLRYKNNSDMAMQNISIRASLSGTLFDFGSVRSEGSFNSIGNNITWNVGNASELQSLAPGEERAVTFEIQLKDFFPISRLSDKNYSLKVNAHIESPTVPTGVAATKTVSVSSLETKVSGRATIEATAFYYDTSLGSANTGPYPPRANQPTQYTVHWKITNYSTDISNIRVSSFLQADSKFTGKIKSNIDTQPQYNSRTGEIYWDIKNIPATRGVIGEPIEAIFQVENTPAVNQVGGYVQFMDSTRLTARDDFTGIALEGLAGVLTTVLLHDNKIQVDDRRVRE